MVLIESSSLLLRSLFLIASFELEGLVSRFQSLRVLSLKDMRIERVPESIWRLRHLRYLDLCYSGIKCLPQAITRLENLQTLNLYACLLLEELPRDFTKLPNLSHLTIAKSGLTALPSGFGKMTSLLELDEFIVGESNGVDSVPALNLTGNLHIKFCKWHNDVVSEAKRADLKDSHKLNNLTLTWTVEVEEASPDGRNKMLMYLQLPPNLRYLQLHYYNGDEMQCRWFDGLSKLVFVTISSCHSCTVLPHLSQLPHLKYVHLGMLDALEYVEDEDDIRVGANCGHSSHYFPALEVLELSGLPRLKEWTRPSRSGGERQQLRQKLLFPRLSQMEVVDCKELVSIPLAPKLESLSVCRCNGKLFKSNLESLDDQEASSTLFTSLKQLKIISIDNGLVSLSISSRLCKLEILGIGYCSQLRSLMIESLSSIQYIEITHCSSWTSILKGNFPFLETLTIRHCNEDDFEEEEERNTTSTRYWQGLTSLRSLELDNISKLKKLPTGIACLTELQMLTVGFLENLTTLPEEIGKLSLLSELRIFYCPKLVLLPLSLQGLSSLKILYIEGCPELKERYRKPDGQDYHLLQHIPDLQVGCYE
ncbi:hypothetical protein BVRB_1g014960 isoform B [Beta vulgaris subsp. vulgaris]|nr:hypothetical protein BVRB_1g014960 isoform B [Beta vulgaris subsp. vulgaris]